MSDKVSVLISSCDKYEDAWYPFFFFFRKFWNCPYNVYLNTETKRCSEQNVVTLNSGHDYSWSQRLKISLKKIDSDYIIFLLEDFFLQDTVKQNEIDRCVKIMDSNKKIAVIDFEFTPQLPSAPSVYNGFNIRDYKSPYFLNCQAAIWRRKDLIRFLSPYESPWQFEGYGSLRAKLYNKLFLVADSDKRLPFVYGFHISSGYGLVAGKWLKSNVDLFNKFGLKVNFNNLGFYDKPNNKTEVCIPKKTIKERFLILFFWSPNCRMGFCKSIQYLFSHPIKFTAMWLKRIKYFFKK